MLVNKAALESKGLGVDDGIRGRTEIYSRAQNTALLSASSLGAYCL